MARKTSFIINIFTSQSKTMNHNKSQQAWFPLWKTQKSIIIPKAKDTTEQSTPDSHLSGIQQDSSLYYCTRDSKRESVYIIYRVHVEPTRLCTISTLHLSCALYLYINVMKCKFSILTRPRPCRIPARKTEKAH